MKTFVSIIIFVCLVGLSFYLLYSSIKDITIYVKNKKNKKVNDINDKQV